MEQLGPVALNVDCDILNADGGTRCASITAANLALRLAVRRLIANGQCLPIENRPTDDERKSGWEAPELSDAEKLAHENRVIPHDLDEKTKPITFGKTKKKLLGLLPGGKLIHNLLNLLNLELGGNGQILWLYKP